MGAIGSGKSTLIDGMVNYILGVEWVDPFRFKIVREDESNSRNHHAHSQTSSVTAYTIHHQEGMAVPYSITIIDTPGYGDARGIKRDKEITQMIHRFLTKPETCTDQIHAVCFVAPSGSCRLTVTQSYIVDSVLSSFAKDFKENIRLLVTFADNVVPPVLEACRESHFPTTAPTAGITYNKFNTVLYASKDEEQNKKEKINSGEQFWDMGKENFATFFAMLEGMKGKDLKSTRDVIQYRQKLEQSLKNIKRELEVYFVKIENMSMFINKMKQHGHSIESTKNLSVEKTIMRPTKLNCKKGYMAYNCQRCSTTCEEPILLQMKQGELKALKRQCNKPEEICKCQGDDHSYEEFVWRQIPVKVEMTLKDMKTEYESKYESKLTTEALLGKCSEELSGAKAKVLCLLEKVGVAARSLESTALRSNALSPVDYISMMRSRVAEEQASGYLIRLDTLKELQKNLVAAEEAARQPTLPTCDKKESNRRYVHDTDKISSSVSSTSNVGERVASPTVLQQPVGAAMTRFERNHEGRKSTNDITISSQNVGSTTTIAIKCSPFDKFNCISNQARRKSESDEENNLCSFCF